MAEKVLLVLIYIPIMDRSFLLDRYNIINLIQRMQKIIIIGICGLTKTYIQNLSLIIQEYIKYKMEILQFCHKMKL